MGSGLGSLSIILYLLEGSLGLPFFAGGVGGITVIAGPTGGYLLGFVCATWVIGQFGKHGWCREYRLVFPAVLMGLATIYLLGSLWLGMFVGWENVLSMGILPFLPGEAVKIGIAGLILPLGKNIIR